MHTYPTCRTLNSEVKPVLTKMCSDSEFDVRYYAEEARQGKIPFFTIQIVCS